MILCSGVFDGLHAGHVHYLRQASQYRDVPELLVVALAPDAYVHAVKGHAPKWSVEDRMKVIRHLRGVDRVVVHSTAGVEDVILAQRPRLFVKGDDWVKSLTPAVQAACDTVGASVIFVPCQGAHRSSA